MNLFAYLHQHGINYERHDHPPVYTVEEAKRLVPALPGAKTKNLFLRDKKGERHILVVVPHEKSVDLKAFASVLEVKKLALASPERLKQHLDLEPGAVSILGIVNDRHRAVEVVVDTAVWDQDTWQCHPLVNTSTVLITRVDVERLLEITGHTARVHDVPARQ
jgi:Ala-tRNA(Pro) deacylase